MDDPVRSFSLSKLHLKGSLSYTEGKYTVKSTSEGKSLMSSEGKFLWRRRHSYRNVT